MNWNPQLYDRSHDFVSKHGATLLSYLQPKPGERILDLGCGTGDLSLQIRQAGAQVTGVDSAAAMIEQAQTKDPEGDYLVADALNLVYDGQFDAIFSNAVFHWIGDQPRLAAILFRALKPGGRLVAEFGGKGNNRQLLAALRSVFVSRGVPAAAADHAWYFPSIAEYTAELERAGFRVVLAEHFDRFTPLSSSEGIKDWFRMFGSAFFVGILPSDKESILDEVQESLRSSHWVDGVWHADYTRIRVVAWKENG